MNEKKIYTAQEAKEYAQNVSEEITIRKYNNGSSEDIKKKTTAREKAMLTNIIYGALLTIRHHRLDNTAIKAAKDTAEFTADLMIPHINGYLSVYNKIGDFLSLYN